jgi:malate dehydrogenase
MDTMTYLALKSNKLSKNKVIGMGGALDSSRFKTYLSKALNKPQSDIYAMVIGGHGDTTMIPLIRYATYNGIPISGLLSNEKQDEIISSTMVGGATLTKLLGTSAWYAPGASVSYLVDSILNNKKKIIPCSVYLEGQYGLNDLCIGVPCIIGKNGIEEIIDLNLNLSEKHKLQESAKAVANMNKSLKNFI